MKKQIFRIEITEESRDYSQSRDGGEYEFGEVCRFDEDGQIISGEHRTSSSFWYCEKCGRFERFDDHYQMCQEYQPSDTMQRMVKEMVGDK
jgi:hypothetical protein